MLPPCKVSNPTNHYFHVLPPQDRPGAGDLREAVYHRGPPRPTPSQRLYHPATEQTDTSPEARDGQTEVGDGSGEIE